MSVFDPERVIKTLARRRVRYVLIGAVAARLQGFPRLTADIDITPAQDIENLRRLASALRDLDAKVYTESVPEGLAFDCTAESLGQAKLWNLVTGAGRVDVAEPRAGLQAVADEAADDCVGAPEGHAALDQQIGEVGREENAVGRRRHAIGPESEVR